MTTGPQYVIYVGTVKRSIQSLNGTEMEEKVAQQPISAKLSGGELYTVQFDVPETIEAAEERWNPDVVYSRFRAQLIVDLQGFMRGLIKQGKTAAEIQDGVDKWEPGVKVRGKPAAEKVRELFAKLSVEEKAELLAQLGID